MCPPTFNRPLFATDKVRFVGDIVAAVVAETRAQAVDAAEAVIVDYDPLPVGARPRLEALRPTRPLLFAEHGSNICFAHRSSPRTRRRPARRRRAGRRGHDREPTPRGRSDGDQRHPRRARGDGGLTCWVSHQAPHGVHGPSPRCSASNPEQVRVVCPRVGGGFGAKAGHYVEYLVAAAAALLLGRPVKWTETRSENMVSLSRAATTS